DVDGAGAVRVGGDAAADGRQGEVAGAARAALGRSAGGSDRDVARPDAADLRGAADVADDRVAGANRGQVERTDVAGLQVARAQRRGQFATDAVGLGVARPGIDARTACTSDSGIAGTDLELHRDVVGHAGPQLHIGIVVAQEDAAGLALALGGDDQPVAGSLLGQDQPRQRFLVRRAGAAFDLVAGAGSRADVQVV